jgi:hypothetical protein
MSGAVQGNAGYWGDYCTAIGRSDRLSNYYTQTENIKQFQ